MSINIKSIEELHYPTLLEWRFLNSCKETNIIDCAKNLCQIITNFNGVSREYYNLLEEKKCFEKLNAELSDRSKMLKNCSNCSVLQKRLDDQKSQMKTLSKLFKKIADESTDKPLDNFEKVQQVFTQIMDDDDSIYFSAKKFQNIKTSQKRKKESSLSPTNAPCKTSVSPSKKRVNCVATSTCEVTPEKKDRFDDYVSTPKNDLDKHVQSSSAIKTSPIIGATRLNRAIKTEQKTPLRNLNSRLNEISSPKSKSPNKVSLLGENSLNLLQSSISVLQKTSLHTKCIPKTIKDEIINGSNHSGYESTPDDKPRRRSESLLQKTKGVIIDKLKLQSTPNMSNVEGKLKNKNLKQSRLAFSNERPTSSLDVSSADGFHGGLRNFSGGDEKAEPDIPDSLQTIQMSLNDDSKRRKSSIEDDEIIDASPSYIQHSTFQSKKQRSKINRGKLYHDNNSENVNSFDDDATMLFTMPFEEKEDNVLVKKSISPSNIKISSKKIKAKKSPLSIGFRKSPSNPPNKITPATKKCPEDKVEKIKLPGWSCQKCKDFFEVVFKEDKEKLREKMDECLKNHSKLLQPTRNTPKGFWDLHMSPTQNTEEFNRRNNAL